MMIAILVSEILWECRRQKVTLFEAFRCSRCSSFVPSIDSVSSFSSSSSHFALHHHHHIWTPRALVLIRRFLQTFLPLSSSSSSFSPSSFLQNPRQVPKKKKRIGREQGEQEGRRDMSRHGNSYHTQLQSSSSSFSPVVIFYSDEENPIDYGPPPYESRRNKIGSSSSSSFHSRREIKLLIEGLVSPVHISLLLPPFSSSSSSFHIRRLYPSSSSSPSLSVPVVSCIRWREIEDEREEAHLLSHCFLRTENTEHTW